MRRSSLVKPVPNARWLTIVGKEIGIRMALGSDRRGIFTLVLREALRVLGIGVALGLAGALALARAIETQLYGVRATDPMVLALVALTLGGIGFVASAVPAERATRIDPVVALNRR